MEKKYVTCSACLWQLENYPDRDWAKDPCNLCKNTRKVIDPTTILCNMCGGFQRPVGDHNEQYPSGLEGVTVTGGYDSYHLFDMTSYTFSFCERCLRKMFNECKIPPLVIDRLDSGLNPTGWKEDQEAYEYRVWKDDGGHHQAYLDKKCNFVKDCPNKAVYTQLISDDFTENCCCEEHKHLWAYGNSRLTKFIQNMLKPFL